MLENNTNTPERKNPFFEPYNTPHDTVPFNRIKTSDYEEAFMEGIRRDNEAIEKLVEGINDGLRSLWNGHRPTRLLPARFNST